MPQTLFCFVCVISLLTFHCLCKPELGEATQDTSWEKNTKSTLGFYKASLRDEASRTYTTSDNFENVSKKYDEETSADLSDQELDDQLEDDNDPDKVGLLPKWVYLFFIYFIAFVGTLGNILVFILMQLGSIKSNSYSVYLRFLAVTDSLHLIGTATEDILDHQFRMLMTTIYSSGEFVCKAWTYLLSFTPLISPWLIAAFAFDRYAAIIFPFRLKQITTMRAAFMVCLSLTLVAGLESLVFVIPTKYDEDKGDREFCYVDGSQSLDIYSNVRMLCLESTLPCTLILYFNLHVICAIRESLKFRKQAHANASKNNKASNRTTLSLVAISLMAFCTLTPIAVVQVLEALWERDIENLEEKPKNETDVSELFRLEDNLRTVDDVWPLLNVIQLLNFGQNFYVMMLTSPRYRKTFVSIMCSCCFRSKAAKQLRTGNHDQTRNMELAKTSSALN